MLFCLENDCFGKTGGLTIFFLGMLATSGFLGLSAAVRFYVEKSNIPLSIFSLCSAPNCCYWTISLRPTAATVSWANDLA